MCAISHAEINKKKVFLYIGYVEGEIRIDGVKYKVGANLDKVAEPLSQFTKEELIDLIIELVKNAEEA